MKMKYDSGSDAVFIEVVNREIKSSKEIDKNTILNYDGQGNVISIELLFMKERMPEFDAKSKEHKLLH